MESMNLLQLIGVLVVILALLPSVSGIGLGALVGAFVDLVKAVAKAMGKPLTDGWGGKLAVLFNALVLLVVVGIFLVTGAGNPLDAGLSDDALEVAGDLQEIVEAATAFFELLPPEAVAAFLTLATLVIQFVMQLVGAKTMHNMVRPFAPDWFSLSGPTKTATPYMNRGPVG